MSKLILRKMARDLCRREGNAWSLKDFENGVPRVTMLTMVADEKERALRRRNNPALIAFDC
jgi:hypothetical protein